MLPAYIFESEELLEAYQSLHPEKLKEATLHTPLSFLNLLESTEPFTFPDLFQDESPEIRTRWIHTLTSIRKSGFLDPSTQNFLLQNLFPNPKNIQLKNFLELYSQKTPRDTWSSIQVLTESFRSMKDLPFQKYAFFSSTYPSPLFQDCIQAALAHPRLTVFNPWAEIPTAPISFRKQGNGKSLEQIIYLLKRNPKLNFDLSWFAPVSEAWFFRGLLKRHGISFSWLGKNQEEKPQLTVLEPEYWVKNPSHYPLGYLHFKPMEMDLPKLMLSPYEIEKLNAQGIELTLPTFTKPKDALAFLRTIASRYKLRVWSPEELELKPLTVKYRNKTISFETEIPLTENKFVFTHFSATQLETYKSCPAKYFYRYRGKLTPPEKLTDAWYKILGTLTHRCLELSAGNLIQFLETSPDPAATKDFWQKERQKSWETSLSEFPLEMWTEHPLEKSWLEHCFLQFWNRFPGLEKMLNQTFGKRKVLGLEVPFEIKIGNANFRGKIDRIDELESGRILVLDYKTGTVDFTPSHLTQDHFQLPIYLLAVQKTFNKPLAGMLFYDLKANSLKRGLIDKASLLPNVASPFVRGHAVEEKAFFALLEQALENIQTTFEKVEKEDWTPAPSPENCRMCSYGNLCRVEEGMEKDIAGVSPW